MCAYIPISLYIDMTNSITSAQEDKETNTLLKNKANKNKRKNKEEDDEYKALGYDIEDELQGICPQFYQRTKRRLREGKPINPLWHCYPRHRLILEW